MIENWEKIEKGKKGSSPETIEPFVSLFRNKGLYFNAGLISRVLKFSGWDTIGSADIMTKMNLNKFGVILKDDKSLTYSLTEVNNDSPAFMMSGVKIAKELNLKEGRHEISQINYEKENDVVFLIVDLN